MGFFNFLSKKSVAVVRVNGPINEKTLAFFTFLYYIKLLMQGTELYQSNEAYPSEKDPSISNYRQFSRFSIFMKYSFWTLLVNMHAGGSPAQSEIICDQALTFCRANKLPLYTFAEDLAASGGYFISCIGFSIPSLKYHKLFHFLAKGDKFYVDSASLVGSIGAINVRLALHSLIQDKKIERRGISSNEYIQNSNF